MRQTFISSYTGEIDGVASHVIEAGSVIPAKAGIHIEQRLDSHVRRNDMLPNITEHQPLTTGHC
jgi:hypothetical protein